MKTKSILLSVALLLATTTFAQTAKVNTQKTTVKWMAEKVTGKHDGFVKVKEGSITLKKGTIEAGTILMDMASITCTDLTDAGYNAKLIGHLKSDDFFAVEKFPTAKLVITKASAFVNGEADVTANLTIKSTTLPITFKVKQHEKMYHATLVVDRSKYDVRYGSKSFFDDLGDKVIYDEFTLEVMLVLE